MESAFVQLVFLPPTFMAISATRTEYGIKTPWGVLKQHMPAMKKILFNHGIFWVLQIDLSTSTTTPFAEMLICRSFSQVCAAGNSKANR